MGLLGEGKENRVCYSNNGKLEGMSKLTKNVNPNYLSKIITSEG